MNNADIAWMLVSTALVLLMTPALGFFYGGLVRSKNALNTIMMSFVALGPVAVVWALLGYSIAFAPGGPVIGSLAFAGLNGVGLQAQGTIPHLLFMAFQGTFAIITAALISGAVVERMRFNTYLVFIVLWVLFVYAPVAHWVWGGGFLATMGAIDFAGGAVVHVNAAAAALVAALVVGPRRDYGRHAMLPHNVPFTMLGAGLLWFGWFGFNAGSALSAGPTAALAFANTLFAPAATLATWSLLDLFRGGRITAVGAATAIVVGLVVVTPAAGYIGPASALALGALGAIPSYFALIYRARTKLDDSLDVVAAHGTGGATGAILTGVFADAAWSGGPSGLIAGNGSQVLTQLASVVVVLAYSGTATFVILKGLALVMPLRISGRVEGIGMDVTEHGEEAYTGGDGAILVSPKDRYIPRSSADIVAVDGGGQAVKLIVAIVRPEQLSEVLEALFHAEVRGVTISRVQGHGGETEQVENYRGTTVKMALAEKVRLEIAVSNHFVQPTVDAILSAARTGEVGDGKIMVLPIEKIYRIRTGEEDQDAVTPVHAKV